MPEGHSVHRIARQFQLHFVGLPASLSSPQGRFAAGAAELDGHVMVDAKAVGQADVPRVRPRPVPARAPRHVRGMGLRRRHHRRRDDGVRERADGRHTNQRGTILDSAGEDSLRSIGAPRRTRLRMSEQEKLEPDLEVFPPEPVGQVRVRILTESAVADLRGPTACEVLRPDQVALVLGKLGPDALADHAVEAEERFTASIRKRSTPIGLLLMDQGVVSGIGNVYRCRTPVPSEVESAHSRQADRGGHRARSVAGLDEAADHRGADRPDAHHGRAGRGGIPEGVGLQG